MKLHEYQTKQIFETYGIPVPMGKVADTPQEARKITEMLGGSAVIKSQVLVGGRGKAGGVKVAKSPAEAEALAAQILALTIKGLPVRKVLVDPLADIKTEIYLGITNDRAARKPVLIASAAGGVDIEEVAAHTPEKIIREHIDPSLGLRDYQTRNVALGIDLPRSLWRAFSKIAQGLYQAFSENCATLAEINPLVITNSNQLVALDGKMDIDDNALFRLPALAALRDPDEDNASEAEAREHELSYIALDGNIGCMVNGAGLAMGTMDIVKHFGGNPANFLDIGGGANAEKVAAAMRIILKDSNVKAMLINIFGGITRCDEVAKGILEAMQTVDVKVPMVVRLVGTNEAEGKALLASASLITADSLADAAQKAVKAAQY
ncbi:MAG TPA: ADP-forming succinate--CoA ligase subunit beta [Anaerolineales bacterium]|nr:ADP-forming succinate--CoA ligase subunit beta [Anaerolineales bacterium]